MKKFLLLSFLSLSFMSQVALAQEDKVNAAQTLRLASATYDQGRLHELEGLLLPKLKVGPLAGGFDEVEKVTAYRFLILSYIYLEEPEKADATMLELLRTDPYYKPNKDVDPAEYIALYNTFRTRAIYRLGILLSLNSTVQNGNSFNRIGSGTPDNQQKIGFGAGVTAEIPITDRLTLNPELHYVQKKFGSTFVGGSGDTLNYSTTTSLETQGWLSLPVLAQYRILGDNSLLHPFVSGGFNVDYLLSASNVIDQKRSGVQSIEPSTYDMKGQRQNLNISVSAGAGIKFAIGGGFIIATVRYSQGLTRVNSPSTIYSNQFLAFNDKFTDGVFKLNSMSLSVGYVQNFFNPKKKNRK